MSSTDQHCEPRDSHPAGTHPRWLWPVAAGAAVLAGAVMLAPVVLPALGIGTQDMALEATTSMHVPTGENGPGLAGGINKLLESLPLIGPRLAEGGLFTAAASAITGIGGVMLGNTVESYEKQGKRFSFGKMLKLAAVTSSVLIALPSLLTGIAIGVVFLCNALGDNRVAAEAVKFLSETLGSSHRVDSSIATVGALAGMSHIATCGAAVLPAALGVGSLLRRKPAEPLVDAPHEASPEPAANPHYTDGSIAVEMKASRKLVADKPAQVTITLRHRATGKPVTSDELAVEYTKKLHLYVADESLRDYHHIHPEPTKNPGEFSFSFTPSTSNNYNAWADFTLLRDDRTHRLRSVLPGALDRPVRAHVPRNNADTEKGMNFQWSSSEPLRKGAPSIVEVNITDMLGNPVTDLQPVLGAYAHLVGLSADGKSIIHTHPLGTEPTTPENRGGPKIRFHVEPDFSGPAQFYLQVRRGGKDVMAEFGQQVFPAQTTARELATRHTPGASASPAM